MSVEAKLEILLEAVDNASATFKAASDNIKASMGQVTTAQENVDKSTKAADVSTTNLLLSTNNLATGCASLVFMFENVERAQFAVEKAHLAVNRATDNAEKSQAAYNEAVSKYGADSDQAKQAADKLAIAQEALNVAQDRAGIVQNNLNQAMVSAALNVIPTLISIITSATTIIANMSVVTKTVEAALDAMGGPVTLLIAGVAALAIGIYAWISASSKAADEEKRFNEMMEHHEATMQAQIITWDDLANALNSFSDDLSALQKKYDELNDKVTTADSSFEKANVLLGVLGKSTDDLKIKEEAYVASLEKKKAAVEDAIKADQEQLDLLHESARVHDLYISTVIAGSESYRTAIDDMASSFRADFGSITTLTVDQANTQRDAIQGIADQYGVSWDQAYQAVKSAVDKSQSEMEKLTSSLEEEWNKQHINADTALTLIAARFDDAFSAARFDEAASLVAKFSEKYGLSIDDSRKYIEDFIAAQAEVPLAIQKSLVEEAQDKFETFKNCVSGKALTMSTDVAGTMADMGAQVTDLINKGFVGEAQAEMQAYVNCSTSKVSDMVTTIDGYMTTLTTQHNEKVASLTAAAEVAYGAEKDAILAMLEAENAGYQTKMDQLRTWQQALYGQLLSDAAAAQGTLSAILDVVWAKSNSIRDVLAGAKAAAAEASAAESAAASVWKSAKDLLAEAKAAAATPAPSMTSSSSYWQDQLATSKGYTSYEAYRVQIANQGGVQEFAEGGIFTRPTLAMIGEAGPEAVVPIDLGNTLEVPRRDSVPQIVITGPLIEIRDSLIERPLFEELKQHITKLLNSVLIEATSSGAPITSKRIRI